MPLKIDQKPAILLILRYRCLLDQIPRSGTPRANPFENQSENNGFFDISLPTPSGVDSRSGTPLANPFENLSGTDNCVECRCQPFWPRFLAMAHPLQTLAKTYLLYFFALWTRFPRSGMLLANPVERRVVY